MLVHHPRPGYTGTAKIGRHTLHFRDGVAESDGPVAAWRRAGYRITPAAPEGAGFVDLESLTVKDLQARAAERGVDVPRKARKAELIVALAATPDNPADGDDD